jgi:hypothetical protein
MLNKLLYDLLHPVSEKNKSMGQINENQWGRTRLIYDFQLCEHFVMNDLQKDILTRTVFLTDLLGFLFGEFIISSTLFASAVIASNVNLNRKRVNAG